MSRPDARNRCSSVLPLGLTLLVFGVAPSVAQHAPNTDVQQSAYRSSIAQESIRKQADEIQAELIQLATELKLNGIGSANLATLSQASTHLSGLSQQEMQQVINSLQSASITPDELKRQQSLVGAYQVQQGLVLQLKQLAALLTEQQASNALITQIENLIARQAANIRETFVLKTGGHTADQLDAREQSLHSVVVSEQTSIGGQIELLFSSLTTQVAQATSDPTAKAVLDAMTGTMIEDAAPMATQLTNAGPFPEAVDKQSQMQQSLMTILRAAVSKSDTPTRLEQAKNQLDQVLADQKDLTHVTKQAKVDPTTLANRQAEINDRAEVAKVLLTPLNPDAAKNVDDAQQDMKQSADALAAAKTPPADTVKQDDATQALTDADKLLDQQIAAVQEQENQSPTDQVAQLQKAQDEIKQAQQQQQANPQEAAKSAQQAQKDALAQAPDAAGKLADAAAQLRQRPQASSSSPQSSSPPDSASQDLAQAAQDIQNQKDALAQAAQEYQAMAQEDQALDEAVKQTTDADQSLKTGTDKDLTDPKRKLADAQTAVSKVGQNSPAALPTDAKQAVQKASDALKGASASAAQPNRSGAEAQTQQALAALQQAKKSLGKAMAQAKSNHGQGKGQMAQSKGNPMDAFTGTGESMQFIHGSDAGTVERGAALVVGGLSPKDRDAITQFQAEKSPPEYAPLVQQYLKNLADVPATH